ncbi:MAG: ABC transporter permease [Chloroflexi bacterium]|nr:ABC transporter permease [Chloroflexota bacterium]
MSLSRFILRRLFLLIFMLLGVTVLTFFLARVVPGDPAQMMAGMRASQEQVENMRARLGLDRPLPEQFANYLGDLMRGDLGTSIMNKREVTDNLRQFFPATVELALAAFAIAALIGLPLGVLAALYKDRWVDQLSRAVALAGIAFPSFWLGIVLILIFFFHFGWLPAGRRADVSSMLSYTPITNLLLVDSLLTGNGKLFGDALSHLVLPAITLALGPLARFMRFTRAVLLEELHKPYVLTAHGKGLRASVVLRRHTLRNALIPTVTVMGLSIGYMFSGSVLVETIFNWPGLGQYAYDAVFNLDYPSIVGVTLLTTVVFMLINLIIDITYAYLDPRIRF